MTRVLIAGIPRSGTSWIGRTLGKAEDTLYLHEPDSESVHPFAVRAKQELGRYPALAGADRARDYELLWRSAFGLESHNASSVGRFVRKARARFVMRLLKATPKDELDRVIASAGTYRPFNITVAAALAVPRRPQRAFDNIVVKSVHSPLALDWIVERCHPRVLVVFRHPLNTIASWLALSLPDQDRGLDRNPIVVERVLEWGVSLPDERWSPLARAAWHYGVLTCALQASADRHPDWVVVSHDHLCTNPAVFFPQVAAGLELPWGTDAENFLNESNRPGERYKTYRVASELPERWRERLSDAQVEEIRRVLMEFPVRGWPHGDTWSGGDAVTGASVDVNDKFGW